MKEHRSTKRRESRVWTAREREVYRAMLLAVNNRPVQTPEQPDLWADVWICGWK